MIDKTISKTDKPKRSPLPPGIDRNALSIELATKLINLPMRIGNHAESGKEILFGIGKFGPYLKYDGKFTSIPKSHDPFNLNLETAIQILATPKVTRTKKNV